MYWLAIAIVIIILAIIYFWPRHTIVFPSTVEQAAKIVKTRPKDKIGKLNRAVAQVVVGGGAAEIRERALAGQADANQVARELAEVLWALDPIDIEFNLNEFPDIQRAIEMIAPAVQNTQITVFGQRNIHALMNEINKDKSFDRTEVADAVLFHVSDVESDTQNVHDTQVVNEHTATWNAIACEIPPLANKLADADILAHASDRDKVAHVLAKFDNNEIYSYGHKLTDRQILTTVWLRSQHPRNAAVRDDMVNALAAALIDCIDEHGKMVCVGGRCARVLSSMVTLDFDETVGASATASAYKHEIYNEVSRMISAATAEAQSGTLGQQLKDSVADYIDPQKMSPAGDEFRAYLAANIVRYVSSYTQLSERVRDKFISDCKAAADIQV